jgi:iron complex transport system substrate-binding protein
MKSVLAVAVLCLAGAASAATFEAKDDRGRLFRFERHAERIVTLAPHLAEIAFAAGAGDRLAGVSSYSDFPEAAAHVPVVATHGRADAERIALLKPDLVLAWLTGTPVREIDRLERMGLRVLVTEVRTLDDIPRLVRLTGAVAGSADKAISAAKKLEDRIEKLQVRRREAVPVFVEIWPRPLMTVNGSHLISDVLRRCGARNVFDSARSLTFFVSREQLLVARPHVMIVGDAPAERPASNARLHAVDARWMHSQGPRLIDVAQDLCARLAA